MESQYNKKKHFIVNTIYFFLIALIAYVFFNYAINLISPFIFALLVAYLLQKPTKSIAVILKLPPKMVSVILVLFFYSTIGLLFSLIGVKLISVVTALISGLPMIYETQLEPFLLNTFDGVEQAVYRLDPALVDVLNEGFDQFVNSLGEDIKNISLSLVGSLSTIASSLPEFLIKIVLMIISTFFIAMDYDALAQSISRQFTSRNNDVIQKIKQYVFHTLFVVVRSYLLIMGITFIELSVGLSIIGIPNAVLIAFIIAIFDILPVLGTGGIMIPWTIITFFQGNYRKRQIIRYILQHE